MGWSANDLGRGQEEPARPLETPVPIPVSPAYNGELASLPAVMAGLPSSAQAEEVNQPSTGVPGAFRWPLRLGVAWIAFVLLVYYLVHPPLSGGFFANLFAPAHHLALDWQAPLRLLGHVADLGVACWLLLLGIALGQRLWRWSHLPAVEGMLRVALGGGLGLGALSLATFALGVPGWLSSWTVWGGLLMLSALCARDLWWVLCWLREQAWEIVRAIRRGSWLDRLLWSYILLTVLLLAVAALLPPTAWDALMYHLAAPAVDLQGGHVLPSLMNVQGYQPELVEMLYLDGLLLRGDGPAALLHAGFGLLSLLVVVVLARRIADPARGAALALRSAALFLSIPSLVLVLGWPYIDGALVYYELAALCALLCWWNTTGPKRIGWLLLAGVLLGLGLDTKYTAAFALGAVGALVLWRAWRKERLRAALWQTGVLVCVAVLVGSPWLWRNLILTGDPLFPYHLGHLFLAGPQWDDLRSQAMVEGPGWGWAQSWRLLTLPLEVTLYGTQSSVEFDATIGPLLLLLLPLGLLAWKRRPWQMETGGQPVDRGITMVEAPRWSERQVVGVLLVFAALLMLCWDGELLSSHFARQSRLFFPLFAALTLPAAAAWMRLKWVAPRLPGLHRLVSLAVVVTLALGLLGQMAGVLGNGDAPYLLGLQSREAYLADHLDPYYAAIGAINALPPSASVLSLWEVRSYYASRSITVDPFLDIFNYYYRHYPTAQKLAEAFHQAGFTHVLFYAQGLQLLLEERPGWESPPELAVLHDFLTSYARPIYQDMVPLVKNGPGVSSLAEQLVGQRGWYKLYVLLGT